MKQQRSSTHPGFDLCQLQSHFQVAVRKPEQTPSILSAIQEQGALAAGERFDIYRSSIIGNHIKALRDIYCVCEKLVGSDFFTAMAEKYVMATESDASDLGEFGSAFSNFISSFPPSQSLPYLPDVTRLEWCWHLAYHGADIEPLEANMFQQAAAVQGEQLTFHLAKNIYLLRSRYPVHKIWEVNQENFQGDEVVDLAMGGVRLLIWRPELDVSIQKLTQAEWALLESIANGHDLGSICQDLTHLDVAALLPQCVQNGWLIL